MKIEDFKKVVHFSPEEKWGNLEKLEAVVVFSADAERKMTTHPFIVNCACEIAGHDKNGEHPKGRALDGYYKNMHLLDQFLLSERSNLWGGIGLYPFWKNPGLHRDKRPGQPLRWIRDKAGTYHYNPSFEQIINITKESKHPMCFIK